ncbi:hypothetical protein D3C87_1944020 [compost metagenome]
MPTGADDKRAGPGQLAKLHVGLGQMLARPFVEDHIDHQPWLVERQILHLQPQSGADLAGAAVTGQHIVRR